MMNNSSASQAPVEQETAVLPVFPLQQERVDAYIGSKVLYERLFFAGFHDRCLLACAWLFDHPGDVVSIGSDAAIINHQCYRLTGWQREEVRRLDGTFAQETMVTKRQYLALARQRETHRRRVRR